MQYYIATLIFSVTRPYRKPIYTNTYFMIYFTISFCYFVKMILFPDEFSQWLFDYVVYKDANIKYYIFIIGIVNFGVSYAFETGVIPMLTRIYYRSKYFETLRLIQTNKYNPNLQELQDMKKETKIKEIN
jgi:hypothetical protein